MGFPGRLHLVTVTPVILDKFRLDNQVAVVTGGGRGLGAAIALAFADVGADVVIASRTQSELEAVADKVRAAGRRAHIVTADLAQPEVTAELAGQAVEAFGRLDIVVNNVGGTMPNGLLTTSTMGRVAGRGFAAYGTAKAALAHYTRLAALDLCPRIRVNAIAPGSIATSALDIVASNDEFRVPMEKATPLRRLGDPDEIAAAAVYLASPAGAYLTGKVIEVDGGITFPNLDLPIPDL